MYFGTVYYPEHWMYPYSGTKEDPEARWERDAELMSAAGMNVVRMGDSCWGLYEREEGKYDFDWMRRAMDVMDKYGIQVVLATPTSALPPWMIERHPEILPVNSAGMRLSGGTNQSRCLNSDCYWEYSKKIITALAKALGSHKALIAWQIDNGLGGHFTEACFNEETKRDWHAWLKAKYETLDRLNECLGSNYLGQVYTDWSQVPMPMDAPTFHNPALMLDWDRFSSDTIVAFVKMQASILKEITPDKPITTNLRALTRRFDHFDVAEVLDFVASDSYATVMSRFSENACDIDIIRSLKKTNIKTPDGSKDGFWVMEQKAGHVNWQDVNSLVRPGLVRLFTYQQIARGANGILYYLWRQPRIGTEKFFGGVLTHRGKGEGRVYKEISQIGEEVRLLGPLLKDTKNVANVCILYSHDNDWALQYGFKPNKHFSLKEHIQLFYNAFYTRNIPVDFARPGEDLSRYKLVIAPSLYLLAGGEADLLRLYVMNGGTLVGTFNTGLVDEHNIAPDSGYPHDLTDVFGVEIVEFDPIPPGEENQLVFKAQIATSHVHPARLWCDLMEPKGCQVLATYSKDFYAGSPAITMNVYGQGKAIYIGTMSHQTFYYDIVNWLKTQCSLFPLLKVPETVEVCLREKDGVRVYFLLNHQNTHVRLQFLKPVHDYLTGETISGNYDLAPRSVLVLDEHYTKP
jgi:beta-galactosidase